MQKVKSIFRGVLVFAFFLAILLASNQSQANGIVFTEYSSRSAFEEAVPLAQVQDWDSYSHETSFTNDIIADDQGIIYHSSYGDAMVTKTFLPSTEPNGLGHTGEGYFASYDTITFVFPTPILAFGIDINTASIVYAAYRATINPEGSPFASSYYDPFPDYSVGQFIGFTSSEPFSKVTIALAPGATAYTYTLDTLRYQTAAPLPGSLLLLGSGLLGLVGWRRFRKG